MPGKVFNKIFAKLDSSGNGKISREEVTDFMITLIAKTLETKGDAIGEVEL